MAPAGKLTELADGTNVNGGNEMSKLAFVNGELVKVETVNHNFGPNEFYRGMEKVRQQGVTILTDKAGKTLSPSIGTPGLAYNLSLEDGCECLGFEYRGYCKHYAKLVGDALIRQTH